MIHRVANRVKRVWSPWNSLLLSILKTICNMVRSAYVTAYWKLWWNFHWGWPNIINMWWHCLDVWMTCFKLQAGWCDSQGTVDDLRSKMHMRHEGAVKRERAIAYALSHQVWNHLAAMIWNKKTLVFSSSFLFVLFFVFTAKFKPQWKTQLPCCISQESWNWQKQ